MGKIVVASAVLLMSAVLTVSVGLGGGVSEETGQGEPVGIRAVSLAPEVNAEQRLTVHMGRLVPDGAPGANGRFATSVVRQTPVEREVKSPAVQFYY